MERNLFRSYVVLGAALLLSAGLIYAVVKGVPLFASPGSGAVPATGAASAAGAQASSDKVVQFLVGLAAAAILAIFGVLFTPVKVRLAEAVNDIAASIGTPVCRVLVFGPEGAGKTTLIRRIVALRQKNEERSTMGFYQHSMVAPMDLKLQPSDSPRSIKVQFADYQGQDPATVLTHPPAKFFGLAGARRVNVIIFLADFFPRYVHQNRATQLTNEEIISDHGDNARDILKARVAEVSEYLSKPMLNLVFSAAGSRRELVAVRLVLNKLDLLEDLLEQQLLGAVRTEAHTYAERLYKDVIENIGAACGKLKIADRFKTVQISGKTRAGVDELMTDVLDLYDRATSKTTTNEEV